MCSSDLRVNERRYGLPVGGDERRAERETIADRAEVALNGRRQHEQRLRPLSRAGQRGVGADRIDEADAPAVILEPSQRIGAGEFESDASETADEGQVNLARRFTRPRSPP